MGEHTYRGPFAWARDNLFLFGLAAIVAAALIGDRVARSGVNPADDPKFVVARPAETQPTDAEPKAETPQATGDTASDGGNAQTKPATGQPAADDKSPAASDPSQSKGEPAPGSPAGSGDETSKP